MEDYGKEGVRERGDLKRSHGEKEERLREGHNPK